MPDIKLVNDLNNSPSYCCYLLNVRSHKDYVCLEIDDCPSSLDITKSEDYSIDSSHVVMPILDKIRFNIKSSNIVSTDWFEDRLQVYLVGKKIFPLPPKPCLKCNLLGSESSISQDLSKNILFIDASCNTEFDSKDDSNNKIDIMNELTDSSDKISIERNDCNNKSEMLTINTENSDVSVSNSVSLPNFFIDKQFVSKSSQTLVTLGDKDLSYDLLEFSNDIGNRYGGYDINTNFPHHSMQICQNRFNESASIIELLKRSKNSLNTIKFEERMKCYPFQTYKNFKYWSFINSAKSINSNELDFNSFLKSVDIQRLSSRNINLIQTLSPSSIILQLKNGSESTPQYIRNSQEGNCPSISGKWRSLQYKVQNKINNSNDTNSNEEQNNSSEDENTENSKK